MSDEEVKAPGLGLRRIRGQGWRRGAPTPKQKDYLVLHGLSLDYGVDENWPITAGKAGEIIYEYHLEQRTKPPEKK
jgi:hypothetical protein